MRTPHPSISVLWSLLWRAVIYMPLGVSITLVLILLVTGIIALPIAAALYAYAGAWSEFALSACGWMFMVAIARWLWCRSRRSTSEDSLSEGFVL